MPGPDQAAELVSHAHAIMAETGWSDEMKQGTLDILAGDDKQAKDEEIAVLQEAGDEVY